MGATGNVVDGWIAGELDVEGALSGDRRAIENIGLSAASGAYGNVVGKSLVINFFGIMIIKFIKCQDMLEKNLRHSGFQEDATRLLSNL